LGFVVGRERRRRQDGAQLGILLEHFA
jgi:hypothetical protein